MRNIWNPWHGCRKISEGCQNCYMFFLDAQRNQDGSDIYRVKNAFDYPIQKDKCGNYKIKSGKTLRVCLTSDFFLEEADEWRDKAWQIIEKRPDLIFSLLTKRVHRVLNCLPKKSINNFENISLGVSVENQKRADERIPVLLDLPFRHKWVMSAPFIEEISLEKYLKAQLIEEVIAGGENYTGARPLHFEWVEKLSRECKKYDVSFTFFSTGAIFFKGAKKYMPQNKTQKELMAKSLKLDHRGKPIEFCLAKPKEYNQIKLLLS